MILKFLVLALMLQTDPAGNAGNIAPDESAATSASHPADASLSPPAGANQPTSDVTTQVAKHVKTTLDETPLMGWVVLFLGILVGLTAGKVFQNLLRRVGEGLKRRGWIARGSVFQYAAGPSSLAIFTAGLAMGLTGLVMDLEIARYAGKIIGILNVVALGWFLFNLIDIIEIAIRRITTDDTILQLIRKALRIFLLIMFGLFVAENFFGANISAWLAGLGLAGLAFSLAAQGPIKNIFGSVTVVLDRPFGLGDNIRFGDKTGVVETMGFRSTKLRTAEGHLVTIPNSKLIEDVVENISARPYIRRSLNVTIPYDTPPAKIEQAVQLIHDLLAEPFMATTFDMAALPPQVHFNNLNADSLNISIVYWYQLNLEGPDVRNGHMFNAQTQEFNLKLLRAYAAAEIGFAFPTQTLHLAGDPNHELAVRFTSNGDSHLPGESQRQRGS